MLSKLFVFIVGIFIFFAVLGLIKRYRVVTLSLFSRIKDYKNSKYFYNVISKEEAAIFKDQSYTVYQPVISIFNTDEWYLLSILEQISLELSVKLFAKIPLTELFKIDKKISRVAQSSALAHIKGIHVDYIFTDIKTSKPLLVIQLENSSATLNRSSDLTQKSALSSLIEQANLPLLYVAIKNTYDVAEIKAEIMTRLKMKPQ